MEVARIVTCTDFPWTSDGGVVVTVPNQEPARVFIVAKDFCASESTGEGEDMCMSDCPKADMQSDIRTAGTVKRPNFMDFLLKRFLLCPRVRSFDCWDLVHSATQLITIWHEL